MVTFILGLLTGILVSMLIALYGGHKIQQQNEAKAEKLMQNYLTNETQEEFYEKRYES
jgi:uncharacterized membrane-anchored protein YhcB (DUF1043 family)